MYLVDTDVFIWILRNNPVYLDLLDRLVEKAPASLSVITVAEVYKNFLPAETIPTERWVAEFTLWNVDPVIAKQAGLYWQQYHNQFQNLQLTDCLIAATAKLHDLTVVTLNVRHFPMNDIELYRTS